LIDGAVVKSDKARIGRPAREAEGTFPEFNRDIHYLRTPIFNLPEKAVTKDIRRYLRRRGVPKEAIDEMTGQLGMAFSLERRLRKAGQMKMAGKMTLATAMGVSLINSTTSEQD